MVEKKAIYFSNKIIRKNKYYFLNNAEIPAISKNIALKTLMCADPTITNMVAMINPTPATSSLVLT